MSNGLILPQMAHYIYCYYRVCGDKPGKTEVEFAVPTGACGNITGRLTTCSYLCRDRKKMGIV